MRIECLVSAGRSWCWRWSPWVAGDGGADGATDITPDTDDGCAVTCGLVSLQIIPPNVAITSRSTRQLDAFGTYIDNSIRTLTIDVHWTSSNPSGAVVSNTAGARGLVTGRSAGQTTIGAELGGISASTTLTVMSGEPLAIAITPLMPFM